MGLSTSDIPPVTPPPADYPPCEKTAPPQCQAGLDRTLADAETRYDQTYLRDEGKRLICKAQESISQTTFYCATDKAVRKDSVQAPVAALEAVKGQVQQTSPSSAQATALDQLIQESRTLIQRQEETIVRDLQHSLTLAQHEQKQLQDNVDSKHSELTFWTDKVHERASLPANLKSGLGEAIAIGAIFGGVLPVAETASLWLLLNGPTLPAAIRDLRLITSYHSQNLSEAVLAEAERIKANRNLCGDLPTRNESTTLYRYLQNQRLKQVAYWGGGYAGLYGWTALTRDETPPPVPMTTSSSSPVNSMLMSAASAPTSTQPPLTQAVLRPTLSKVQAENLALRVQHDQLDAQVQALIGRFARNDFPIYATHRQEIALVTGFLVFQPLFHTTYTLLSRHASERLQRELATKVRLAATTLVDLTTRSGHLHPCDSTSTAVVPAHHPAQQPTTAARPLQPTSPAVRPVPKPTALKAAAPQSLIAFNTFNSRLLDAYLKTHADELKDTQLAALRSLSASVHRHLSRGSHKAAYTTLQEAWQMAFEYTHRWSEEDLESMRAVAKDLGFEIAIAAATSGVGWAVSVLGRGATALRFVFRIPAFAR